MIRMTINKTLLATSYNPPVVDPVENVKQDEDGRRNPHCPGVNVVHQGLFPLCETHRNLLERELISYVLPP